MWGKNKIFILLLCVASCVFVGCSSSIDNENQYIDTYDKTQDIAEQNAEISANRYEEKANQIYGEAMEEAMSGFYSEAKEDNEEGNFFDRMTRMILRMFYNRYGSLRTMAPLVSVMSIVLGGIIFVFSKKNKPRKRFALYGLIIGIPILMIVLVYGIGIANQIFLFN